MASRLQIPQLHKVLCHRKPNQVTLQFSMLGEPKLLCCGARPIFYPDVAYPSQAVFLSLSLFSPPGTRLKDWRAWLETLPCCRRTKRPGVGGVAIASCRGSRAAAEVQYGRRRRGGNSSSSRCGGCSCYLYLRERRRLGRELGQGGWACRLRAKRRRAAAGERERKRGRQDAADAPPNPPTGERRRSAAARGPDPALAERSECGSFLRSARSILGEGISTVPSPPLPTGVLNGR